MIIYGTKASAPVNKICYLANVLGLDYQLKQVNLGAGEGQSPEYLKLHPVGKVPVMDDDGFILFESGAIVRYLGEKEESDLYPSDLQTRAIVNQWTDFASLHILNAVSKVVFNKLFYQIIGVEKDERSLADGLAWFARYMPACEQQLSKQEYLAGEKMTIADITLLAALDPCEPGGLDVSQFKSVKTWRDKLIAQDFYQKHHKSYMDSLEAMRAEMQK